MKNILPFLLLLIFIFGCESPTEKKDTVLNEDSHYPRWMQSDSIHSDQTSGITFIKSTNQKKIFLIADDIGKIYHFTIENDTVFNFEPVNFSPYVVAYLDTFPKADFEEIVYDKYTGNVYLSIEGNNPDPKKFVGIYKLNFENDNVLSNYLMSMEKLKITPSDLFTKYVANNIGYEGLAVDENHFYLGLEGFSEQNIFADSTLLFIVDKNNLEIKKTISTKSLGIGTICGLYSDKNNSIYGIDRNSKKLFHIEIDNSLNVISSYTKNLKSSIPGYPKYDYVAALESITSDDDNNFYLVDDPWKTYYIPSQDILSHLDPKTINNFKEFIPVIYKYSFQN